MFIIRFLSREKTFVNFAKVFSAKIYFQAIRYHASGRGALGYRKFAKVFSAKIYFQAIPESFLLGKKPAIPYTQYYQDQFLTPFSVCKHLLSTLLMGLTQDVTCTYTIATVLSGAYSAFGNDSGPG